MRCPKAATSKADGNNAICAVAGIDLGVKVAPDVTTVLRSRRLPVAQKLTCKIFGKVDISPCVRGPMRESTQTVATISREHYRRHGF